MRRLLKPFGVTPYFAQSADGIASIFAAIEAHGSVALLTDGLATYLTRSLVMRYFSPSPAPILVVAGLPLVRPNPHAERFVRIFQEEAGRAPGASASKERNQRA